jgi:hypothetical protein
LTTSQVKFGLPVIPSGDTGIRNRMHTTMIQANASTPIHR